MAKISISLPDNLKQQLDAYAEAHGHSVSETVQLALEALFGSSPGPGPTPGPGPVVQELQKQVQETRRGLDQVRRELASTQQEVEHHRQCLNSIMQIISGFPSLPLDALALLTLPPRPTD